MSSGWLHIDCSTAETMVGMSSLIKSAALKIGGSLTPLMPEDSLTTLEEEDERGFLLFLWEELSGMKDKWFHFVLGIISLTEEENLLCYSPQCVIAGKSLHMQLYSVF